MNYHEILELIRAGYTRDEINAMTAQSQPGATPAQPQADPAPAHTSPLSAQPQADPAPAQTAQQISNEDLAKLLTAIIQQTATQPAQQTQATAQPAQQTQTATQPAQQTQATAQPAQQTQTASPSQDAAQILRSLGALTQGVAIPPGSESLEDRMANSLYAALGVKPQETKKEVTR